MTGPGKPGDGSHPDAASQNAREKRKKEQEAKQREATRGWNQRQRREGRADRRDQATTGDQAAAGKKATDWNKPKTRGDGPPDTSVPDDSMGEALRQSTKPPKVKGKIIPGPEIDTAPLRKKGRRAPDQLTPHEPKAPPKDLFGSPQHVPQDRQDAPLPQKDVRDLPPDAPLDSEHDWVFPAETVRRSDQALSPEERAERQEIARPNDGMAFGHGKDKPEPGEPDRWYKQLSAEQRKALPNARITIYAMASRTGSEATNMSLTERRADHAAQILVDKYGVKRDNITVMPLGEEVAKDSGAPDGKDNRDDRVAIITIDAAGGKSGTDGGAAKAGAQAGDQGKPPEPPHKTTIKEGLRDAGKDFLINLLSEAVGAAKTVVDYTVKVFTSIGELHDKNKQEAIARGVQFSVAVLGGDVRNPKNPHVSQGKPYTVKELHGRVRFTFGKEIQRLMPWMKIENRDADKQLQQGVGIVVKQLNGVLRKAKTPAQRRQVIRAFVRSAEAQIAEGYRKRGSGGYGSR